MSYIQQHDVIETQGSEYPIGYDVPMTGAPSLNPELNFYFHEFDTEEAHISHKAQDDFIIGPYFTDETDTKSHLDSFGFKHHTKPFLPLKTREKIKKMQKIPLKRQELVNLIDQICTISVDFYEIKPGKHIAIKIDGSIVESADSEIELLFKTQGRQFGAPVFVFEAGAKSDSGWSI